MSCCVEIRRVEKADIKALCIRNNWMAFATTEAYTKLLSYADRDNLTTADLSEMVGLIEEHSSISVSKVQALYDLAKICYSVFEEE